MKLLADVGRRGGATENLPDLRRSLDATIGASDVIKTLNKGEQSSLPQIWVLYRIQINDIVFPLHS